MEKRWLIIIVLLLVLIGSVIFMMKRHFSEENMVYDDEQKGLNKQIVISFSHVVAENTPKGLAAQKFAELVDEKTNGRVKVEVFSNGSLYSDEEEIDALMRGDVQMIAPSFSKVTELIPEWQVLDLPFIFEDYHDVERVFTGEVGKQLLAMLEKKGIKGLAFWSNGFKQMTSNRYLLIEPKDFKGLRFRIMPSKVIEDQFRLLGTEPIVVSFNHVYQSLEKQEFDGQENTISNIYSKGFYQFHPYITVSNHGYLGYVVLMNGKFWESLPIDVRKQIVAALEETTLWNLKQSKLQNEQQLIEMKNNSNIQIYELTDKERKEWKEKFAPLYKEFEKKFGRKLLQRIQNDRG
ncbi:C4-dicarboxylate-binding protein DctP [Anoxybacillus calidus]|jgi:tripartite ATP-independent transporter DctP family solute receptor|uniref:C4-dicarboxylate-binding protein DctP n=1 Tax=[Anoxybacillus] calidus TaxID=575178 RepID=A0A7W0BX43_9BACL|nr:TRAP transporter substrate-binding protein [Anoxybacillus calidus]MBA2871901.1 C4-dicarboxylate-binding protein DctP [Anoxybacillus calidus]